MKLLPFKYYLVESNWGWFVVKARHKQKARSEGIQEWGRGSNPTVRQATESEIKSYESQKGRIEEVE